MRKVKLYSAVILLAFCLSFGSTVPVEASGSIEMPPAVVLVQNRNDKMLVNHNFSYDQRIFVPGGTKNDPGFYVSIPGPH